MLLAMSPRSHRVEPSPLSAEQARLRDELQRDLQVLAGDIGPRNAWCPERLEEAALFLETELERAGYEVGRQAYSVGSQTFRNLEVELRGSGSPEEIAIVGAHYDSVASDDCPGANDNGSGVVAVLALARRFAESRPDRTLRFVLFVNEEPPFFQTENMGSRVYARGCRSRGEEVVAMVCLETMGWFSDEKGSQRYPPLVGWFYPAQGDFIAFVGNLSSRALVRRCGEAFHRRATISSEEAVLPAPLPGVGWSDHWSFWQEGYPALMVTDTAPFRYPHYHTSRDTPDQVDCAALARVVDGLEEVVRELVGLPR